MQAPRNHRPKPNAHPLRPDPLRLGPRPLALHLGTAAWTWMSSRGALPLLMNGSLPWKPALLAEATALRASLDGVDPEAFAAALDREVRRRLAQFLAGVERYRRHPYRRSLVDPPTLWSEGTTRLLDFGAATSTATDPVVLFVPSLVNRGYILDLADGNSFLRWLAGHGIRPLLVDWGRPGEAERGFSLTHYIAGRLETALRAATELAGGPVGLVGYCMGGNLALALAERQPHAIGALALLATPWDFHADRPELARAVAAASEPILHIADRLGELSTDVLQALFYLLDPYLAPRKFLRFASFPRGSARETSFVALEDWLNDGVPLAAAVARECLLGWYGGNTPGRGLWQIGGHAVDPAAVRQPTLVLVPANDRIVPPASAEPLTRLIPAARRLQPALGHIGMMVGGSAEAAVWRPLAEWLRTTLAAPEKPIPTARPAKKPRRGKRAEPQGPQVGAEPASLPSQMQQTYNSEKSGNSGRSGGAGTRNELRRNSR